MAKPLHHGDVVLVPFPSPISPAKRFAPQSSSPRTHKGLNCCNPASQSRMPVI